MVVGSGVTVAEIKLWTKCSKIVLGRNCGDSTSSKEMAVQYSNTSISQADANASASASEAPQSQPRGCTYRRVPEGKVGALPTI